MSKIRVFLIEDNRLLREGLTATLNDQPDFMAFSSAGTDGETIKKIVRQRPHVVLLDLGLRNQSSLNVAKQIKKKLPRTEVVVMDLIPAHHDVIEFVKAGVSGFISKDTQIIDMIKTIRKVAKGKKVLPHTSESSLFSKIVEHSIRNGTAKRLVETVKMTKREQNVITLLSQGQSHEDIALKLKIAIYTINSHVRSVFEKLAIYTRLEGAGLSLTRNESKKIPTGSAQSNHIPITLKS